MSDIGIRLQLFIGPTIARPAPYALTERLLEVEVSNNDRERDGFQLTFSLGRESGQDYSLLQSGLLDPPNRVIIQVFIGALPQILIDGLITHHQVVPSNQPGEARLVVTGEDISLKLDLQDKDKVYRNQSHSAIVQAILRDYLTYGLRPDISSTEDAPDENVRVTTQQATDLVFIQDLAQRNGFVFYIEPTALPGSSTAYWGPENRQGQSQPPLSMNMGALTNVDSPITFTYNALGPVTPDVSILESQTKQTIAVPLPGSLPALTARPAVALRRSIARDTARLNMAQANLRARTTSSQAADAVTGSGEVDALRYGRALRSRRLVGVRGVGQSYDGNYYVRQVTHRLGRGEYKQNFSLARDGLGSLSQRVAL